MDEVRLKVLEGINPKVKYATAKDKHFDFAKQELATEEDVKKYAAALEAHYLELIKEDKRIGL